MKSSRRELRARQIEDAAYEILEDAGFEGLSMQAVAVRARASNETLYRWYGDKTGLFEALIRGNSSVVASALAAPSDDPLATLSEIGPVLLAMLLGPRAVALNRAAAADPTGVLGRALAREGRETVAPRIVGVMTQAVDAGLLDGVPEDMAETWFALLIGDLQVRRVTRALPMPRPEYIAARAARSLERLQALFRPRDLDDPS